MANLEAKAKEVVALAGVGDLGKYICEELEASSDLKPIILTRSDTHAFAESKNIRSYKTTYEPTSLTPILDSTNARILISFISPTPPATSPLEYIPLHSAMLESCRQSQACKRFIPAEWAGNQHCFETKDRWFGETRGRFREILRAQSEVEYTGVGMGWLADYFLPRPRFETIDEEGDGKAAEVGSKLGSEEGGWEQQTYMRPVFEMWPIDTREWKACIRGTGEEKQSWTLARDVGKAVVELCRAKKWDPFTLIASEHSTFNAAVTLLEQYYGRSMPRTTRSAEAIEEEISRHNRMSEETHATQVEEMGVREWLYLPEEEVLQQREKFFPDVEFRGLRRALEASRGIFL